MNKLKANFSTNIFPPTQQVVASLNNVGRNARIFLGHDAVHWEIKSRDSIFHGIRTNLFLKLIEITGKGQSLRNFNYGSTRKYDLQKIPLKLEIFEGFSLTPFHKVWVDFGFYQKFLCERLMKLIRGAVDWISKIRSMKVDK